MELTEANKADKYQAKMEFLKDIERHALDDALKKAPAHISLKLRSDEFIKEWGNALNSLCSKVKSLNQRHMLNSARMEQSSLRRQLNELNKTQSVDGVLREEINAEFGGDWATTSLHMISIKLLFEIFKKLKEPEERSE